jgi:hypothetical protein
VGKEEMEIEWRKLHEEMYMVDARGCTDVATGIRSGQGQINAKKGYWLGQRESVWNHTSLYCLMCNNGASVGVGT